MPYKFKAVICHSGAILDPKLIPVSQKKTPFYLIHAKNDSTFDWDERFRPMKNILKRKKYNVHTAEKSSDGHMFGNRDILLTGEFLSERLGYGTGFKKRYGKYLQKARRKVVFTP